MRRVRFVALLGAVAMVASFVAWAAVEVTMSPTADESVRTVAMFVAIAAASVLVAVVVQEVTRGSLTRRIVGATVIGPVLVAAAALIGARTMFISTHDAQFIAILVGLATALAVATVRAMSRPLVADLDSLQQALGKMELGDMSARSDLQGKDEVGRLGRSIDAIAERVEVSTKAKEKAEQERSFMLASLSHDARTPLTAMRAAIEALQDGIAPDPDRYLATVERDLGAIEDIVENIFLLGRLEADQIDLSIEQLDLGDLITEAIDVMAPIGERRGIVVSHDGPTALVQASRSETLRVLRNLLANAIRHAPEDSTVWVVTSIDDDVQVHVLDEGPGFGEDFLPVAFDQFTRADAARDRAHGGAGLGLAVCRGLIHQLGGSMWAFPGPGGKVGFSLQM